MGLSRPPRLYFPNPGDSDHPTLIWSASVYIPAASIVECLGEPGGRWQNRLNVTSHIKDTAERLCCTSSGKYLPNLCLWGSFRATLFIAFKGYANRPLNRTKYCGANMLCFFNSCNRRYLLQLWSSSSVHRKHTTTAAAARTSFSVRLWVFFRITESSLSGQCCEIFVFLSFLSYKTEWKVASIYSDEDTAGYH